VLRLVSPQIVHKFDVKGVALNLRTAADVRRAYRDMVEQVGRTRPDAEIAGVICRRMIPAGHEVILGAKRDEVFGATIMFGLGGLFVEIFKDVTFALAPMHASAAARMVRDVKAHQLLDGYRGTAPADVGQIEQCLLRLSRLVTDFPRIVELDINPMIVGPSDQGASVADVRIRLSAGAEAIG
jgi:acetyltransferase